MALNYRKWAKFALVAGFVLGGATYSAAWFVAKISILPGDGEEAEDCQKFMASLVPIYGIPKSTVFPSEHAAYCSRKLDIFLRPHRDGVIYGVYRRYGA